MYFIEWVLLLVIFNFLYNDFDFFMVKIRKCEIYVGFNLF